MQSDIKVINTNYKAIQDNNKSLREELKTEKDANNNFIWQIGIAIGLAGIVISVILFYLTKSLELLLLSIGCSIALIVTCLTLQLYGWYFVMAAITILIGIVIYGLICLYRSTKANNELVTTIDYLKANLPKESYDKIFGTDLNPGDIEKILSPSSQKIIDQIRIKNVKLDKSLTTISK